MCHVWSPIRMALHLVLVLAFLPPTLKGQVEHIVRTKSGALEGRTMLSDLGREVLTWESIPYAEPPVGELRFQPPKPVKPWKHVRNVTGKPNSCVQISGIQFPGHKGEEVWEANTPRSEDCLYLTVVRPKAQFNKPLPVMVWIYGGSFYSGTTTLELYDTKILSSEYDMVLVSIQYRVASLGFLYLGTDDVPGNMGLLDQAMALKWIKENIGAFGGDSNNITLFSESAGSASVGFHILSPISSPLFHRAILQSATAFNPWALITKQEAKSRALQLAKKMDCPTDTNFMRNIISCMRQTNATVLVNMEHDSIAFGVCGFPFTPIADGNFLPYSPMKIITLGKYQKKPILLGLNQDEGFYFLLYYLTDIFTLNENITVTEEQFDTAVSEVNLFVKPLGIAAIKYMYTEWMNPESSVGRARSVDRMTGDYQFSCPVVRFAEKMSGADNPKSVYLYHFRHPTARSPWPSWTGVMHGDEIAYVFGDPFRKIGAVNYTDKERKLSRDMMTYWTNFAKTGDPNRYSNGSWVPSLGGSYWPVHSHAHREYLEILTTDHKNKTGLKIKECAFWEHYLPELLKNVEEPMDPSDGDVCSKCSCKERKKQNRGCNCDSSHSSSLLASTVCLSFACAALLAVVL